MKKLFILSLAILMVCALSLSVMAKVGHPNEVPAYNFEDNTPATTAQVLLWDPVESDCNDTPRHVTITTTAHVAQWMSYKFSGTHWEWYVRKPGDYFADCIQFMLASNGDVGINFSGFGDLEYEEGLEYSVNPYITTFYTAVAGKDPNELPCPESWVPAGELNGDHVVPDSRELHDGYYYRLWNRIVVEPCNSASTYSNSGTITFTLLNQKDWINDGPACPQSL